MEVFRLAAQFQHVGQRDDPPPTGRAGAQGAQRRAHREGIGVVALVDQGEGPAGQPHLARRAAALQRREGRQRLESRLAIDAQLGEHQKHRQAVQAPVVAALANRKGQGLAADPRGDAGALGGGREGQKLRVGLVVIAEGQDPGAGQDRFAAQQVEPAVVEVQDRRAARRQSGEDLGLGPRHAGFAVGEVLDVDRADGGDRHHVRRDHPAQRFDLARMVHADLEHRPQRPARHPRQGQRHADMVVVGLDRGVRGASQGQAGGHRLGDAGLADRPGDRAAPGLRCTSPRRQAEGFQRGLGVVDDDAGTVDRPARPGRRPRPSPGPGSRSRARPARRPGPRTDRPAGGCACRLRRRWR